jgi:hypothetical protein
LNTRRIHTGPAIFFTLFNHWRKTRKALKRIRILKHNRRALAKEGDASLVFLIRSGRPLQGEKEIHKQVEVDGHKVTK